MMKKRFIVLVVALVLLLSTAVPAMAASGDDIIAALRTLADQRVGARTHVAEAVTWLGTAEGQAAIAGSEAAILGNINSAISAGRRADGTNIPLADLTAAQLTAIANHITAGAALAGVTVSVDIAAIQAGMAPAELARLIQVTLPGGQAPAAAADDVIRQTGFAADHSVLLIVASLILVMLTAAIVVSVRLRCSGGAK